MSRNLAVNKTVKLGGLIDGWNDEAFITMSPMLSKDMGEFAKSRKGKAEDDVDVEQVSGEMIETIKKKFLRGKVYVETEDGSGIELADMEKDDIDSIPFDALSVIFTSLIGSNFDPKAGQKAQENEVKPTSEEASTETPS